MILYFVRHGDPDYAKNILTPLGHKQAKYVAKFFESKKIDKIFSSDSNRAMETAKYTAKILHKKINILPWANESLAGKDFWDHKINNWIYVSDEYLDLFKKLKGNKNWFQNEKIKKTNFEKGCKRIQKSLKEWFKTLNIFYDEKKKIYVSKGKVPKRVILFAHGGMSVPTLSSILHINFPDYVLGFQMPGLCSISRVVINVDKKMNCQLLTYNELPYPKELNKFDIHE